ncbi:flagellar transcriptional regulator FlhD [Cupriavidus metallidurans]|uniref:flagellar transcriptional regulator FlhD n=1 Tax=Cupriavidus metallidurans TaxID=119219 RepID=UPI001CC9E136|nr:flagellar transcriptional regulator FlhD [Cupriavidus metallidurans]UBM12452.1 flagellar transcriptional regulator FlhD [Cupriavidus metallidurans]
MEVDDRVISISDFNLSYLLLAQRMILSHDAEAMFRLGVSQEVAEIIGGLSAAQLVKLARTNILLCAFRFDNHSLFATLANGSPQHDLQQMHMAILLSAHPLDSIN